MDIVRFVEILAAPPAEFTPIPFWFLNDALDPDTLRAQLEDFKQKGVDGVVLHPRIGVPRDLEYLSDAYFEVVTHIVRTAAALEMKIVLYDEAMYPSGSAHGLVARENPAYASVGLTLTRDASGGKVLAALEDGSFIVQKPCGGTIRGIHFGEDDGQPDAPPSADILHPDAVDTFLRLTHDAYYARLKEHFGSTVIGFFTDEPCVLGRGAQGFFEWTDGLECDLEAAGGHLPALRALFDGEENDTVRLYRRLIRARLGEVYYQKLSDWCASHGIALMGHPQKSDDIDEQRYFHIPGQDLVFRWVSPEQGGTVGPDSVQAKCSSDAARHLGRRRNANECFGVCVRDGVPWYFTADDMKWFIDWLGVRGVNLFIPHAFYYSLRGARRDERPPDVGPGNIWWPHYRLFSDYMKRVSFLMTDSKNGAKTAILCESGHMPVEEAAPFYEHQIEFNYLPRSLLSQARAEDGRLYVGGYVYDHVLGDPDLPVSVIADWTGVKKRDLVCESPCPDLRATHLTKDGLEMYFVTNEGDATLESLVSVPVAGTPLLFDPWRAGVTHPHFDTTPDGRTRLTLRLGRRESTLLLFDPDGALRAQPAPAETPLPAIALALTRAEDNRHTYTGVYAAPAVTGGETWTVHADEMVECYVNGSLAGVSFWNPHRFAVGPFLRRGENELTLVVTGSVANRYGAAIPFGLLPS